MMIVIVGLIYSIMIRIDAFLVVGFLFNRIVIEVLVLLLVIFILVFHGFAVSI